MTFANATKIHRIATVILLLVLLTACGPSRENRIVVGSKNFTEQLILGELIAQQIENKTHLPGRAPLLSRRHLHLPPGHPRRPHRHLSRIHRHRPDRSLKRKARAPIAKKSTTKSKQTMRNNSTSKSASPSDSTTPSP